MNTFYSNDLKNSVCEKICINHCSTSLIAKELNIPIKTIEKWITAYNKDINVFNDDYRTKEQIINDLKKKVASLERDNDILKKRFLY